MLAVAPHFAYHLPMDTPKGDWQVISGAHDIELGEPDDAENSRFHNTCFLLFGQHHTTPLYSEIAAGRGHILAGKLIEIITSHLKTLDLIKKRPCPLCQGIEEPGEYCRACGRPI